MKGSNFFLSGYSKNWAVFVELLIVFDLQSLLSDSHTQVADSLEREKLKIWTVSKINMLQNKV